jgi:NAD(P)-dependent dehydrogenase (short-subunit alcohol dehydrogenase family)
LSRFEDRAVIVTGAATGIGAASARAFAREGAHVTILDLNEADGRATAEEAGAVFRRVDVTDEGAVRSAVQEVVAEHGRLHVMHANAGIEWTKRIADTELDEWRRVLDVNLTGIYLATRFAMIQMVEQGGGAIVVTSSPHALITAPDSGAYAASKGGVSALTRALALEGAPQGVRVNALLPGPVRTPMVETAIAQGIVVEQEVVERPPAGRWGTAEDVARAVVLLCGPDAAFVTGQTLVVDGGYTAYGAAHAATRIPGVANA